MSTIDKTEIERLILDWAHAVSVGDRKAILKHHADDILMFDFPDVVEGLDAYDKTWDFFFAAPKGAITYAPRDIRISAGSDVAFASCQVHCDGTSAGSLDFRLTIGLEKRADRWVVVHEHHSVPTIEQRFIDTLERQH